MTKSRITKRSIVVNGKKTSVSLEDEFWSALKAIASERLKNLSDVVTAIDRQREHANLSSAIRLFVLAFYQGQPSGIPAGDALPEMLPAVPVMPH